MQEMKIEGTLYEVKAGVPTKIRIGEVIYDIRVSGMQGTLDDQYEQPQEQKPLESFRPEPKIDLGKSLGYSAPIYIHSNVVSNLKEAKRNGLSKDDLIKVVKLFYPSIKRKSLISYYHAYMRWIEKGNGSLPKGEKIGRITHCTIFKKIHQKIKSAISSGKSLDEMMDIMGQYYPEAKRTSLEVYTNCYVRYIKNKGSKKVSNEKKSTKKRWRPRAPENAIGYDETYSKWVTSDVYDKVKSVVSKPDFVATSKSVSQETNLPIEEVRPALHYMVEKKEIFWKKNKDHIPIYHLLP